MKIFTVKKWLCGLLLPLMAVLVLGQTSFAMDMRDIQKNTSIKIIQDDGKFGLARVKFKGKAGRAWKKLLESQQSVAGSSNPIDVYAAYTSYQANVDPLQNAYWPWVYAGQTYLYVAFKVNSASRVFISWNIYEHGGGNTWNFYSRSTWNYNRQTLSPDSWYFAWWQPSAEDRVLVEGYYQLRASVSIPNGGGSDNDRCEFQVIPLP